MNIVAIVQARMGSTRLPGKVMRSIQGRPMIDLLLERLGRARRLDAIVVATTGQSEDTALAQHVEELGFRVSRGSRDDVLARYLDAARDAEADVIVRITGDCPLVDPELVDDIVGAYLDQPGLDYAGNTDPPTWPDGLDVEVFSRAALERAAAQAQSRHDREHVTPYLRRAEDMARLCVRQDNDLSALRWTVDEPEDFQVVSAVFGHFHPDTAFGWRQVLALHQEAPELFAANHVHTRNQGASVGSGQKLWHRAKQVIPGGNMLLSKRAELFAPGQWPAYFSRASGCRVWDLDGREYIDMSLMGIGTNTLGYGHPEVDQAVAATISAGNMSTLNCPEEVWLAEKLVELHPWSDMVRLARTGGEANAIAIRIARAASGRDKVAICGYHGWHDWYLSANLGDEANLAGHLLPGLDPAGVPAHLRGTVLPFNYNDIDGLRTLVQSHDIGVIKMEVSRSQGPAPGYLQQVRELASARGIVLVFDECTSGFRQSLGGLHKIHGVEPDMAVFGKALGNGYAITAVLGRREIMQAAQATFISSTFWTERIGPSAALKTLEVMARECSWEQITATGIRIQERWRELAGHHGLDITVHGLPALAGFSFAGDQALALKTLLTQEMLSRGYLASNAVYACLEHTGQVLEDYFSALDPVFGLLARCQREGGAADLLKGPVCHGGFKRLN